MGESRFVSLGRLPFVSRERSCRSSSMDVARESPSEVSRDVEAGFVIYGASHVVFFRWNAEERAIDDFLSE